MITTSGARVSILKTAPPGTVRNRLFMQYDWLARHAADTGIVNVFGGNARGYEMELLQPHPQWMTAQDVIRLLNENVWGYPAPHTFNTEKHLTYLSSLHFGTTLADTAQTLLPYGASVWCDTHGDPTFENVMRRGNELVLTDPLPDRILSGELPSIRALDIGKVLQSVIGYEYVKAGTITNPRYLEFECWTWHNVAKLFTAAEFRLARFFLLVHIARLIPYQAANHAVLWTETLERELELWK